VSFQKSAIIHPHMSSTTETIKDRLSIIDVLGGYLTLERSGSNFKARCPFHNEKTPSCFVSPARNSYYCFGCGVKGDIFTFVEQFEGLDFSGALRVLAERAGVPLRAFNKDKQDHRDRLFAVLEEVSRFYEATLEREKEVQEYLASRGLAPETIRLFRLGYAPDTWRSAATFLLAKGYTERELEEAGLIKRTDRGFYDRFRGRIMFPIADSSGRIIAFSGRIFVPTERTSGTAAETNKNNETIAKYLNSPETTLFNKSEILYGFDKAKFNIRQSGTAFVVEGQMDLVLAHQAGFKETVALSGTALSTVQVTLVRRLTSSIVLALDADEAGVRAAGRSAHTALAQGMDVRVARLPAGRDPADLVRDDPQQLHEALKSAKHVIEFYLAILGELGHDERTFRLETVRLVLPFILSISSAVERAHFVGLIARRLSVPEEAIMEELRRIKPAATENDTRVPDRRDTSATSTWHVSKKIIESPGRRGTLFSTILGILAWQESLGEARAPDFSIAAIRERVQKIAGDTSDNFLTSADDLEASMFEAELLYGNVDVKATIEEMLMALEMDYRRERFAEAARLLREAEAAGDTARVEEALALCAQLSKQLQRN
jgi:DNA primase